MKTKKIIQGLFMVGMTFMASCASDEQNIIPSTTEAATTLKAATTIGKGLNIQPSYYNNGNVDLAYDKLKLLDTKSRIKTIRIEIEPYIPISQVNTWIPQTKTAGYQIIATYHKSGVLGTDNASELDEAANWWVTNYKEIKKAAGSAQLVINLMNEWGSHNITATAYATAYNSAIKKVRGAKDYNNIAYSGPIIIDCPGWGQETVTTVNAVKGIGTTNGVKITDTNIILSLHAYPQAWNQSAGHSLNASDVDYLKSSGRAIMIGEFGYQGSGSCDVTAVVNRANSLGYPVLGWCWNGGGTGDDMNMMSPAWKVSAWPYPRTSIGASSYWSTIYNMLW